MTIAGRIAGLMISSGYPPPSATVATQPHIKREQEQARARDPKRFRRELIVCAVVAIGATLITLVTVLVSGHYPPRDGHRDDSTPSASGGPGDRLKKPSKHIMITM